jgi:hypothetical protein
MWSEIWWSIRYASLARLRLQKRPQPAIPDATSSKLDGSGTSAVASVVSGGTMGGKVLPPVGGETGGRACGIDGESDGHEMAVESGEL